MINACHFASYTNFIDFLSYQCMRPMNQHAELQKMRDCRFIDENVRGFINEDTIENQA